MSTKVALASLGELETTLMEIMWSGPSRTAREVHDRLRGKRSRAYTTIMTTLDRLHRKGLLARDKDGLAWRYTAALSRAEYERRYADTLAAQIVREHGHAGVAAFVDAASVDAELLDELAALVAQKRATRKAR